MHRSERGGGSIFNMRVAGDKIDRLRDPNSSLNEEQRQELIYSILLEQLNLARQELINIKRRKKIEEAHSPDKSKSRQNAVVNIQTMPPNNGS